MDEDTTTEQVTPQTGADEAQPVTETVDPSTADETTTTEPSTEATTDTEEAETTSTDEPSVDDKLQKYAKSQGLELTTPSEIKAAQIAMKAQSEATKNYRKTTELEKTVTATSDQYAEAEAAQTGQDPEILKAVRGLQVKDAVRDFWSLPGNDASYEPKMIEILAEKPYLAGDLESLYATAVQRSGNIAAVKSQGKREALESLAHTQTAAVPTGHATNRGVTPKEKPFADLSIPEMEARLGKVRQ